MFAGTYDGFGLTGQHAGRVSVLSSYDMQINVMQQQDLFAANEMKNLSKQ